MRENTDLWKLYIIGFDLVNFIYFNLHYHKQMFPMSLLIFPDKIGDIVWQRWVEISYMSQWNFFYVFYGCS